MAGNPAPDLKKPDPMFRLKKPCPTCPFRIGVGERFQLDARRLREIFAAVAFQCHKTVQYGAGEDGEDLRGDHPAQCAGLMGVLHREGQPNQIMQVGERLGGFDPDQLDLADVYPTIDAVMAAHKR